jgi:ATP-dependent DNA ligase
MVRVRADGFVEPCIPTRALKPPAGPDWMHEIKHDGYRLIVRRDCRAVRLFTRRGHDWTDRYPAIAAVAAKLRAKSYTLDGEAAVSGADGVAVFDALHRPAPGDRRDPLFRSAGAQCRARCKTGSRSRTQTARR